MAAFIPMQSGQLRAIQHVPEAPAAPGETWRAGCVMVGGAGGGLHGPSGMYEQIGRRLAKSGVVAVRLDYRNANNLLACVDDTLGGVDYLVDSHDVTRVLLIGWSFGGAVVIRAATRHPVVIGAAAIATQTYGALDTVGRLGDQGKSLLLIHGSEDDCINDRCSKQLYALAAEPKDIVIFTGDNHGIHKHTEEAIEEICTWALRTLQGKDTTANKHEE